MQYAAARVASAGDVVAPEGLGLEPSFSLDLKL
jgi:hypothetical protein